MRNSPPQVGEASLEGLASLMRLPHDAVYFCGASMKLLHLGMPL